MSDSRHLMMEGSASCMALSQLLRLVRDSFAHFDGSDACLSKSSPAVYPSYGGAEWRPFNVTTAMNPPSTPPLVVNRTLSQDTVLRGLRADETLGLVEELRWYSVAHVLVQSVFYSSNDTAANASRTPGGRGKQRRSESSGFFFSESSSSDDAGGTGAADRSSRPLKPAGGGDGVVPFFQDEESVGGATAGSLHTWRRVYSNGLAAVLPFVETSIQGGLKNVMVDISHRGMIEWIEEGVVVGPDGRKTRHADGYNGLYPDMMDLIADVERGVAPLTPAVLTAVLAIDTERWVASWFPLRQSILTGMKVLWSAVQLAPLWARDHTAIELRKKEQKRCSGGTAVQESAREGAEAEEEEEDDQLLLTLGDCTPGSFVLAVQSRQSLEDFFYDMQSLLSLEVRSKDEEGRFRGVAVPASWLQALVAWVSSVKTSEYWQKDSAFHSSFSSPVPSEEEEEAEEAEEFCPSRLPPPPGPIPTLEVVVLTVSNAAQAEVSPVCHVVRESSLRGSALCPPPVQVLPASLFDFFVVHFGLVGPKYMLTGLFTFHDVLVELVRPPAVLASVNFQLRPPTREKTGDGAVEKKNTVKVGKKEVEIVSDNKLVCVSVEASPFTRVADVLRRCALQAVDEGDMTPEEESLWLWATSSEGGVVEAGGDERLHAVVTVSFLQEEFFPEGEALPPPPPPPRAGDDDDEGATRSERHEEGEQATSEKKAVVAGPTLDRVNILTDTMESVMIAIKTFCLKHQKKYPLEGSERFVELTFRGHLRPVPHGGGAVVAPPVPIAGSPYPAGSYGVPSPVRSPPGISGLTNVGNTCFMNSALQCLSHLDTFRTMLCAELLSNHRFAVVAPALQELFVAMWSGQHRVVPTSVFKQKMEQRRSRYAGYQQQDANEFIDELLDCVCEELNSCGVPKYRSRSAEDVAVAAPALATLFWDDFLRNRTSFIPKTFFVQSKSQFQCAVCQACSVVFEHDSSLSVPITELPPPVTVQITVVVEFIGSSKHGHMNNSLHCANEIRFEATMKIPSVGPTGGAKNAKAQNGNRKEVRENPPLPPDRILQLLRELEGSADFRQAVEQQIYPPSEGNTLSACDDLYGDGSAETSHDLTGKFHLHRVHYWDHPRAGLNYFLYTTCTVDRAPGWEEHYHRHHGASQMTNAESNLSLPSLPSLPSEPAGTVTPPPHSMMMMPTPIAEPAVHVPVHFCFMPYAPGSAASESKQGVVDGVPRLVCVKDLGHEFEYSQSLPSAAAMSKSIRSHARALAEQYLRATDLQSDTTTTPEDIPLVELDPTGMVVPCRVANVEKKKKKQEGSRGIEDIDEDNVMMGDDEAAGGGRMSEIRVRVVALDLSKEESEEEEEVEEEKTFHSNDATVSMLYGTSGTGFVPSISGIPWSRLLEVSAEEAAAGDQWVHNYYTRLETRSTPYHGCVGEPKAPASPNASVSSPNASVSSPPERVLGSEELSSAAPSKPPLVVLILYDESACEVNDLPPNHSLGYLYRPSEGGEGGGGGAPLGWDTSLHHSLSMAFRTANTLSGDDSWYCPRCKTFVTAETVRTLFRVPPCLVLSFRRFKQHGYRVMKNSARISFPDRLDLKPYLDAEADQDQPCTYQLKGVLYHSGTLDYGHYTASAFVTPEGKWGHFNDSHASLTESKSPARVNAYVLCYEREDVLVKNREERAEININQMLGRI